MVKKIVGYDDSGRKVFEREARQYDQTISDMPFKVTINEVIRVVPILALLVTVYVNQQNFNVQILDSVTKNSQAIGGMKEVLQHIDVSLTSITGKAYSDGMPR